MVHKNGNLLSLSCGVNETSISIYSCHSVKVLITLTASSYISSQNLIKKAERCFKVIIGVRFKRFTHSLKLKSNCLTELIGGRKHENRQNIEIFNYG